MIVEVNSEEYQVLHYFNIRQSDLPQLILVNLADELNLKRYSFIDFLFEKYSKNPDLLKSASKDNTRFEKKYLS
jgi:hypothetical protein